MKRLFTICLLLLAGTPLLMAQQSDSAKRQWTLRECIDYALANNLTIQRSNYTVESSEVDLRESQFSRLPSANATASYGSSWGRGLDPVSNSFTTQKINSSNLGGNASLPLINGMRIHNTIRQRQRTTAAYEMDLAKAKNDLIINVATLYINVVFNKELVSNAKLQLGSTQQQLEKTRKQVAAGALSKSEELNLDAQVATNEVNLVQQENALTLSLLQLKQALQIPDAEAFDVEIPVLEPEDLLLEQSRDEIYNIARNLMPEIKSAQYKVQSAQFSVAASKGNLYPRLSLVSSINTNYSSIAQKVIPGVGVEKNYPVNEQFKDNIYRTLGLQLTIPVFNSYTAHSNVQRAKIQSEQAKIAEKETENTLRQNVETAYNNALAAAKSYNASTRQVNAREEAFRMTKQRYDNGAVDYVQYQVGENDLFRSKSDLLRAKYEFIFRKKILDLYQGKPLY